MIKNLLTLALTVALTLSCMGEVKASEVSEKKEYTMRAVKSYGYQFETDNADDESDAKALLLVYLNMGSYPIEHPNCTSKITMYR